MKKLPACEREFDFALILSGVPDLTSNVEDALFKAGCDDATPSLRAGKPYLIFSRKALSLKDAILSAIQNVWAANIDADVARVDNCYLVTQADIARRWGRSRQMVHQYQTGTRGPGGYPPPACDLGDGSSPLWHWCEVAHWLWENDLIKEDILRDAQDVAIINNFLDLRRQRRMDPALTKEVERVLGKR